MRNITRSTRNVGITAGLIAGGAGLALVTGFGPAPSLLASASSPEVDGKALDDTTSTTAPVAAAATTSGGRVVQAGAAGSLEVAEHDGTLEIVSTSPTAGWSVEVEQQMGREVEADFRRGDERVQVDVEIEDGVVRERVRHRDDARGGDDGGVHLRPEELRDGSARSTDDNGDHGSGGHGTDDAPGDDHGTD